MLDKSKKRYKDHKKQEESGYIKSVENINFPQHERLILRCILKVI
jgi:hypothetical protein